MSSTWLSHRVTRQSCSPSIVICQARLERFRSSALTRDVLIYPLRRGFDRVSTKPRKHAGGDLAAIADPPPLALAALALTFGWPTPTSLTMFPFTPAWHSAKINACRVYKHPPSDNTARNERKGQEPKNKKLAYRWKLCRLGAHQNVRRMFRCRAKTATGTTRPRGGHQKTSMLFVAHCWGDDRAFAAGQRAVLPPRLVDRSPGPHANKPYRKRSRDGVNTARDPDDLNKTGFPISKPSSLVAVSYSSYHMAGKNSLGMYRVPRLVLLTFVVAAIPCVHCRTAPPPPTVAAKHSAAAKQAAESSPLSNPSGLLPRVPCG